MENTPVNFREIRFSRDTKVNYKDGNPVINTVFSKYDKDNSGDFDEEEWNSYQKELKQLEERKTEIEKLKQNVSSGTVSHYSRNIEKLNRKIHELRDKQMQIINRHDFDKLIEFEKKHNVARVGYTDDDELPQNAKTYDISAFQMGIYDEKEDAFTGKTFEKGYLKGFDTLSEDEKEEYLKLLKNAAEEINEYGKLEEKISGLNEKLDKNLALQDLAQNGMIDKVGTADYENQVYEQYRAIRNEANPFYRQIKDVESKYASLRLKANPTQDEKRLLEQYRIQLSQLEEASEMWSISDAGKGQNIHNSSGFRVTNLSEQAVYKHEDTSGEGFSQETETITDNHSVGVSYSNQNWNASAGFTKGETYYLNADKDTVHTYNANVSAGYGRENWALSSSSNISADDSSISYTHSVEGRYGDLSLSAENTLNVNKYEMPDENGNMTEQKVKSNSANLRLSYETGKFTNTAGVGFEDEGTTFSLGSRANFGISSGKSYWNIGPSSDLTYNSGAETFTVNPSVYANYSYNSHDLRANVMLNNNLSITTAPEMDTDFTNSLNLNGAITYKNVSFTGKYNNYHSSYSTTNTFGAEVAYNHPNAGKFAVEYSRQNSKSETSFTGTDQVMFTYSAPVDTITSWFKKK